MIKSPGNVTGKGRVDELSSKMKQGLGQYMSTVSNYTKAEGACRRCGNSIIWSLTEKLDKHQE